MSARAHASLSRCVPGAVLANLQDVVLVGGGLTTSSAVSVSHR